MLVWSVLPLTLGEGRGEEAKLVRSPRVSKGAFQLRAPSLTVGLLTLDLTLTLSQRERELDHLLK